MSSDAIQHETLIQPFSVGEQPIPCNGLNLYFSAVGGDVLVTLFDESQQGQIGTPLAGARLQQSSIKTGSNPTRVGWPLPVMMKPRTRYIIAVDAADTTTSLLVAVAGEQAQDGSWIVQNRSDISAMKHISKAGIVTEQTGVCMRFDVLQKDITQNPQSFVLGTVEVSNAGELSVLASGEQPTAQARLNYTIELLDVDGSTDQSHSVDAHQLLQLATPFTGNVRVKANLRHDETTGLSASLDTNPMLMVGEKMLEGTYITPAIGTLGANALTVIFEASIPSGAGVQVHAQIGNSGVWTHVPYQSASSGTAGLIEITHHLESAAINAADNLRLRLTLTGTVTARPYLQNLRAVTL